MEIAVSKRLSLEQFQFVVDAFQRAGRDRVVVPGQQTLPVFVESPGNLAPREFAESSQAIPDR